MTIKELTYKHRNDDRIHPYASKNFIQQQNYVMSYIIPMLYVFRVLSHNKEIQYKYRFPIAKYGDTHRLLSVRLAEWEHDLQIFNDDPTLRVQLIYAFPLVRYPRLPISKKNPVIRDYPVHKELILLGYEKLSKSEYGSDEFFRFPDKLSFKTISKHVSKIIKKIFNGIERGIYTVSESCTIDSNVHDEAYERNKTLTPWCHQKRAIEKIYNYYIAGGTEFLLNHDPRTGKTCTAMWAVNKLFSFWKQNKDISFGIITTAMPSVDREWRKTIQESTEFENIIYSRKVRGENRFECWIGSQYRSDFSSIEALSKAFSSTIFCL